MPWPLSQSILVRSCLLITLIKCLKGHKSLGSLCSVVNSLIVSGARRTEGQGHLLSCCGQLKKETKWAKRKGATPPRARLIPPTTMINSDKKKGRPIPVIEERSLKKTILHLPRFIWYQPWADQSSLSSIFYSIKRGVILTFYTFCSNKKPEAKPRAFYSQNV